MGLYVLVLHAGIVEGALRDRVAQRLVRMIEKNDYRLDTGFVSTPHLLEVLTDSGRKDLAYQLLFQTTSPSWLYMVENGRHKHLGELGGHRSRGHGHRSRPSITTRWAAWATGSIGTSAASSVGAPGYRHIVFSPDAGLRS